MLSLPLTIRIWLAAQPADLRKSFDSLAALVRDGLRGDPLSGDIFVFRNKAPDRIKLLLWEEDGLSAHLALIFCEFGYRSDRCKRYSWRRLALLGPLVAMGGMASTGSLAYFTNPALASESKTLPS